MPSLERKATAYEYLAEGIAEVRVWARREKLLDVVEKLERLEWTAQRLAQEPKSPLKELGYSVVLEPRDKG